MLQFVTRTLVFFDRGARIFNLTFESKFKVIYANSSCLTSNANSSDFLDGGYSYLTQCLPEVYGLQGIICVRVKGQGQITK